jgi:hypothetical protein
MRAPYAFAESPDTSQSDTDAIITLTEDTHISIRFMMHRQKPSQIRCPTGTNEN